MHPGRRSVTFAMLAALGTTACSPVRILNALAPQHLFAEGLAYGDDPRQRLDIYRPTGRGPFPVVMFIYGGRWETGDRATYRFVGDALAEAGFLTVVADYRLYPAIRYPAFLQDGAQAFAWVRANARRFDGKQEAPWLIGHSAGAYNAAMLALDARWLRAAGLEPAHDIRGAIGLAGPYDFLPIKDADIRDLFGSASSLAETQPINHVTGHSPPMLLLAGMKDKIVDPGNAIRLGRRIALSGGSAQTVLYPDVDHIDMIAAFSGSLRFCAPSFRDAVRFMSL